LQHTEVDPCLFAFEECLDGFRNTGGSSEGSRHDVRCSTRKNSNGRTNVREGAYHLDCRSISSECEDRIVCGSVRCGELRTVTWGFGQHHIERDFCARERIHRFLAKLRASA
jgi:hypothetical protein